MSPSNSGCKVFCLNKFFTLNQFLSLSLYRIFLLSYQLPMVGDDVVTSVMPPVPHLPVLEVGQVGAEVTELLLQTVRGV